MSTPKVSVIICCYNQQSFIRETVESVLAQTYPNLEVIITDDGSTDATPAILQEYAQRHPEKIKIALSEKNTGIPGNFNRGLKLRTGEFTAMLDGDDVMLPAKIETQVALMQAHPKANGCYHDADVFESETGQSLGRYSLLYNGTTRLSQGHIHQWLKPRYAILQSSQMYRSSACPPHGYDERLRHYSEFLYCIETLRTGTLLATEDVLVRYRRHARNVTDDPAARQRAREYELLACAILDSRYPELLPLTRQIRLSSMLAEALKCHREGNAPHFRLLVKEAMAQGAVLQGLAVWAGASLFGRRVSAATGGSPYQRPNWVKRFSRWLLQLR
jgi:glycosyltransferase involved in cell wall biosynthesis